MQIKRKPTAWFLFAAYLGWDLVIKPVWTLNVERAAEQHHMDTALSSGERIVTFFQAIASYIPGSFGLGFVTGGLIFAYWDSIALAFRRFVLRKPDASNPPPIPEIKAWLGEISVTAKRNEQSRLSIFMRVINWGTVPFKVARIEGNIVLKHDNGHMHSTRTVLPKVILDSQKDSDAPVEPGHLIFFSFDQILPNHVSDLLPDMFAWEIRPYLELENFSIILEADDCEPERLKMPDSVRLTAGAWEVRTDQTMKIFKSDEEHRKFKDALFSLAKLVGKLPSD